MLALKRHITKARLLLLGTASLVACSDYLLARDDSLRGANACAGTAVHALIGVDYINVACRDSLYGALANTGTASNARVGNFVSHSFQFLSELFVCLCMQIYAFI